MKLELLFLLLASTAALAQGYNTGLPIPGLPKSVGPKTMAQSTSVTIATNQTPITVTSVTAPVVQSRYHDASAVNINNNVGAWVELGGASPLTSDATDFYISANISEPTQIGIGPNAGAVTQLLLANQGEGPSHFGVTLTAGSQMWIRSLNTNSITSGYITVNLSY